MVVSFPLAHEYPWRDRTVSHGWAAAVRIDQGPRPRVEDAARVLPAVALANRQYAAFAVFDGVGGEPFGQEAAQQAASSLEAAIAGATSPESVLHVLNGYVRQTQGATTAVLVLVPHKSDEGVVLSVGDSRAEMMGREGVSVVTRMDRQGVATVTQCLGLPELDVASAPIATPVGATVLLSTDGADGLRVETRQRILTAPDLAAALDQAADELLRAGVTDNVTLLAARRLA